MATDTDDSLEDFERDAESPPPPPPPPEETAAAPSPEYDPEQQLASVLAQLRVSNENCARAGDVKSLWITADSSISQLCTHFVTAPEIDLSGSWPMQLQHLWHLYYVSGRYCSEADISPLVLQIVETAERGLLSRRKISRDDDDDQGGEGGAVKEEASVVVSVGGRTFRQRLWRDLPFLVPSMMEFWVRDCAGMSRNQRVRLSLFLASLVNCSTASWSRGLCGIVLVILRDTLEVSRPLVDLSSSPVSDNVSIADRAGCGLDKSTIADLLPSVNAWILRAGVRIIQLCEAGDSQDDDCDEPVHMMPQDTVQLGRIAEARGVKPTKTGFSSARWLFWFGRLEEIAAVSGPDSAAYKEDSPTLGSGPVVERFKDRKHDVGTLARQVADNMLDGASQNDSRILRELTRMGKVPL
ncbi:hypothetical protein F4778DRAFT_778081 [Xylariomycetidae sp. FL2044]|nr:hypothetical protein F4778DRAFT_778081 [Xylariomycetidae sp. FL2044]